MADRRVIVHLDTNLNVVADRYITTAACPDCGKHSEAMTHKDGRKCPSHTCVWMDKKYPEANRLILDTCRGERHDDCPKKSTRLGQHFLCLCSCHGPFLIGDQQ